jgi:hypothetical protein
MHQAALLEQHLHREESANLRGRLCVWQEVGELLQEIFV